MFGQGGKLWVWQGADEEAEDGLKGFFGAVGESGAEGGAVDQGGEEGEGVLTGLGVVLLAALFYRI